MTIGLRWKRWKDGRMYFIASAAIKLPAHCEGSGDETIAVKACGEIETVEPMPPSERS